MGWDPWNRTNVSGYNVFYKTSYKISTKNAFYSLVDLDIVKLCTKSNMNRDYCRSIYFLQKQTDFGVIDINMFIVILLSRVYSTILCT